MRISTYLATYRELWSIHTIRWLFIARFLAHITFYSTVIVQYQSSRGLNLTAMFALESIISIAAWLFEIPMGLLADRIGYKRILILGYGLNILSLVLFATTHGFWLFALGSVFFGITLACLSGCEDALAYESLPEGRADSLGTSTFAFLNAAQSAGFLSGVAVGSFMGVSDPALPVMISLLPLTLAFLAILRLQPQTNPLVQKHHDATSRLSYVRDFLRSALLLLRQQPRMIGLSLLQSSAFALTNAIFWYNQPYFLRSGIAVLWFGPITALAIGLGMIVTLSTPAARRWLGTYGALALSCIIPGIGFLALTGNLSPLLTLLLVTLVIAGPAWRQSIISDELNRRIENASRATTLSILSFIGSIAGIALNPLIGLAGDLGLPIASISLGLCLIALGLVARMLV